MHELFAEGGRDVMWGKYYSHRPRKIAAAAPEPRVELVSDSREDTTVDNITWYHSRVSYHGIIAGFLIAVAAS